MSCPSISFSFHNFITRKLSYRKDDRAMRPIYGCPEKFRESWLANGYFSRKFVWAFVPIDTKNVCTKLEVRSFTPTWDNRGYWKKFGQSLDTPMLPFLHNFKGLLFAWTLWICVPNLKFVSLPVPEIKGVLTNFGSLWIRPRSLFSQIFKGLLFTWTLWIHLTNLKFITGILQSPQSLRKSCSINWNPVYIHNVHVSSMQWPTLKTRRNSWPTEYTNDLSKQQYGSTACYQMPSHNEKFHESCACYCSLSTSALTKLI